MACFMMSTSLTAHVRLYPSVTNVLLHDPCHGTILFLDCGWDDWSMCCTLGLREQISLQKIGHRLAGFCGNLQESCHLLPGDVESCEALSLPPQMATSRDGPSGRDISWKLHSIAQQFAYVWLRAKRCLDWCAGIASESEGCWFLGLVNKAFAVRCHEYLSVIRQTWIRQVDAKRT